MKIFFSSFSRSSNNALSKLKTELEKKGYLTDNLEDATYILAAGDRIETFNFVLQQYLAGKHIIHLWAGEVSQGTYDELFRHAITMMSDFQLCTNKEAKEIVDNLLKTIGKTPNSKVVGNVMLDNLEVDESFLTDLNIKKGEYNLILYNPCLESMENDIKEIFEISVLTEKGHVWIMPNNDKGREKILQYCNTPSLPRPMFLGLLKNCNKFISNSSCIYYEAPFFLPKDKIVNIGLRNKDRRSKFSKMNIKNATSKIISALEELEKADNKRRGINQVPVGGKTPRKPKAGK